MNIALYAANIFLEYQHLIIYSNLQPFYDSPKLTFKLQFLLLNLVWNLNQISFKLWFFTMNHSLTAWTLAILFRILVLVFGLDIFIFFSFQCSIIHVWVISRWCHRQSHFERNVSEQFYFENNFFETIISKLFSTAQDQIKNWIRIREFTEDIGRIHE